MTPEKPADTQSTVLVVEDDPVLNRLLTRQLAKAGHAVGSADTWAGSPATTRARLGSRCRMRRCSISGGR